MSKKIYQNPVVDIVRFEVNDVITLSTNAGLQGGLKKTSSSAINGNNIIDF